MKARWEDTRLIQRSKGYANYGNSGSERHRVTDLAGRSPDNTEDQIDQAPSTTSASAPDPAALAATRQRLHGIGECLMAGRQRRAGGWFTLRVTPGGFATTGEPALRLDGTEVVVVVDESRRVAVAGTFSELADALGVDFGPRRMPTRTSANPVRATTRHWTPPRPRLFRTGTSCPTRSFGLWRHGRHRSSGPSTSTSPSSWTKPHMAPRPETCSMPCPTPM